MTRVRLAEVTAEIGVPIHRVAITRIEGGEQLVTVTRAGRSGRCARRAQRDGVTDQGDQLDTLRYNLVQAAEGIEPLELRRDTILKMLKGSADV
jgi:hypothetical protein